ncbi:hypothetical protein GCM10025868_10490 [Angustibacter aerolatus]|uniref:Acyl-CoA dehydrogenase n=1 Tax=Angustibacter aerolatus TaxID=1162965 RepID=A0ABQ6JDD7_9ACTN|nr:acyl-CoA dehydrogenase family protein [Angustibacter aerolatus]GMA85799.1 hypothetical protein GCM10025868_10490 [Angustibacter aerolatus]
MDFTHDERTLDLVGRLEAFMTEAVLPAEPVFAEQAQAARDRGEPWTRPPVLRQLQAEARGRGLWNLFLPDAPDGTRHGAGLTNVQYAPLAEVMGRSPHIAPEACNCNAPDTGNMEVLAQFGTPEQQQRWLGPLLDGRIRSAFCMTEPDVASSDATNIRTRIRRDGDDVVVSGRKWWSTGAMDPAAELLVVMGQSADPDDEHVDRHRRQSMVLVPRDTPGVTIVRGLTAFGYDDAHHGGHAEVTFDDVRVPASNLLVGEGEGFAIAQARLGPGRVHHCMRLIGIAERALEPDVPPGVAARRVRQAARGAGRRAGAGRVRPHRDRAGAAAGAEGRVADGHRRQPRGAHRDPGDQGAGALGRAADRGRRHPGARRRRRLGRHPARRACGWPRARCGWPTAPTRCTAPRWRAASLRRWADA